MAVSLDRFMFKEKTIYKMASFLVPIARKLKETTARMTQILAFKTFSNKMAFGLTSLDFEPLTVVCYSGPTCTQRSE